MSCPSSGSGERFGTSIPVASISRRWLSAGRTACLPPRESCFAFSKVLFRIGAQGFARIRYCSGDEITIVLFARFLLHSGPEIDEGLSCKTSLVDEISLHMNTQRYSHLQV